MFTGLPVHRLTQFNQRKFDENSVHSFDFCNALIENQNGIYLNVSTTSTFTVLHCCVASKRMFFIPVTPPHPFN